ncbi:MAG: hypothetical protein HQ541_08530 [Mariniphaga sp.]|nr:hypothetical protein [Mariniphaga sp.]
MKKLVFLFISILIISGGPVFAQSVDDIINKHLEIIGQEKLAKAKSYTVEVVVNQMGMELPMTMKMKRPDKFRMEVDMQGQKMIQAFDGKVGWAILPWISSEPQDLTDEQLKQARDQVGIDDPFYQYKDRGLIAEFVGNDIKNEVDVFHIKLIDIDGKAGSYYIDTKNYYLVSTLQKVNSQGTEIDVESTMSDYQITDGVAIARSIESKTSMGNMSVKINKIELNTPIDDAIFIKPVK